VGRRNKERVINSKKGLHQVHNQIHNQKQLAREITYFFLSAHNCCIQAGLSADNESKQSFNAARAGRFFRMKAVHKAVLLCKLNRDSMYLLEPESSLKPDLQSGGRVYDFRQHELRSCFFVCQGIRRNLKY
jgi:hypothetical protein